MCINSIVKLLEYFCTARFNAKRYNRSLICITRDKSIFCNSKYIKEKSAYDYELKSPEFFIVSMAA